jgi:hypothetical protein
MNGEPEDPVRLFKLGNTRLYLQRTRSGSYLLHGSDGTLIAPPFTRADAEQFARDLLRWFRETDTEDEERA